MGLAGQRPGAPRSRACGSVSGWVRSWPLSGSSYAAAGAAALAANLAVAFASVASRGPSSAPTPGATSSTCARSPSTRTSTSPTTGRLLGYPPRASSRTVTGHVANAQTRGAGALLVAVLRHRPRLRARDGCPRASAGGRRTASASPIGARSGAGHRDRRGRWASFCCGEPWRVRIAGPGCWPSPRRFSRRPSSTTPSWSREWPTAWPSPWPRCFSSPWAAPGKRPRRARMAPRGRSAGPAGARAHPGRGDGAPRAPAALVAWRRREVGSEGAALAAALALVLVTLSSLAWKVLFGCLLHRAAGPGLPRLVVSSLCATCSSRRITACSPGAPPSCSAFWASFSTCGAIRRSRGAPSWPSPPWPGPTAPSPTGTGKAATPSARAASTWRCHSSRWGSPRGAARVQAQAERRPWLLPAALLLPLVLWNLGFVAIFRSGRLSRGRASRPRRARPGPAAPARGHRRASAHRAYDFLAGEYVFGAIAPRGTLSLAQADDRTSARAFTPRLARGRPRLPLGAPPRGLPRPALARDGLLGGGRPADPCPAQGPSPGATLVLNGTSRAARPSPPTGCRLRFAVPPAAFRPGENQLCLRFARGPSRARRSRGGGGRGAPGAESRRS